jgi:ribosome-binding protein aMBF1 (putative translation factor)
LARKVIEGTLHTKPKGQTHWSTRSLAKKFNVRAPDLNRIEKRESPINSRALAELPSAAAEVHLILVLRAGSI